MRRLSRTRLFLLEMLVNLLVFCVGAAICLMTLSQAYSLSAQSRVESQSLRVTENAAMAFRAADGDLSVLPSLLFGRYEDNTFTMWYSQNWQPVPQEDGIYRMVIRQKEMERHIIQGKIMIYPPEGDPIKTLTVYEYIGDTLKEAQ